MDKALSRRRFLCISRPRHIEKHSAKALFDAELRAFCSAKRLPGDACGTGWFQRLFQVFQGLAVRQLPPLHARCKPRPDFAPALIAAKPEKPCDGGVFGAFYLLLKSERNTCGPGGCLACALPSLPDFAAGARCDNPAHERPLAKRYFFARLSGPAHRPHAHLADAASRALSA